MPMNELGLRKTKHLKTKTQYIEVQSNKPNNINVSKDIANTNAHKE